MDYATISTSLANKLLTTLVNEGITGDQANRLAHAIALAVGPTIVDALNEELDRRIRQHETKMLHQSRSVG